ncbi:pseudaminic acid cytidylyltransferase [Variovorax sp. J22G21]|uniref:pseudaminic acid cytidylyltransferase n=1 Tax=Variovorax fucosicus TaxID=3053517 RepID=UPI002577ADA2|nr:MULTISPECIES: pseudaminic acid cytidylyltransferase [unclassified Variovorax]MDM0039460.1 pseudaminic acid cytidylyltransferase [Variovorax sp. J22R193]MDM0064235.1 pseudaminic acid cytidylyltransferase [Variovorax sp. J22G21]
MKLAVIPARGGSKRIPRKNIKPFCGKPIIAWSIAAAYDSGCFDRVIVSTDDAEIAQVARDAGAEAPFVRPFELSDDHAGTIPVVRHAIEWQAATGETPSLVCCIYATAPFLLADDIRRGLDVLERSGSDFAFSVAKYPSPIQRAFRTDAAGRLAMFNPEHFQTRSQDLEEAYYDAGQFYWGRAPAWQSVETLFGPASAALVLAPHRVQDIDTSDDWVRAEWMFKALQAVA